MSRPKIRFPFDDEFDFSFRPETYWPETPTEQTVLASASQFRRPTPTASTPRLWRLLIAFAFAIGYVHGKVLRLLGRRARREPSSS